MSDADPSHRPGRIDRLETVVANLRERVAYLEGRLEERNRRTSGPRFDQGGDDRG